MALNTTFDALNYYFSGQGVVMIGQRDPVTGLPLGLRPVGNVSDLKITVATTVIDHKGSQDGQRAIDARLQTETKATAEVTIDNWIAANLALAIRGNDTFIPAGAVSGELFTGNPGLVSGFQYINVNNVVLATAAAPDTALVAYVDDATPWDYKLNENAGSVQFAGTAEAITAIPTAVTVGSTTVITVPNTATVGSFVTFAGFTGANASALNGQTVAITAATSTSITVAISTTGDTITTSGTPTCTFGGSAPPTAVPTAITVGNPTVLTVTNSAQVGDSVTCSGFTGADASILNGGTFVITAATGTAISINVNTTGGTITIGADTLVTFINASEGTQYTVSYNYGNQYVTNTLTQPLTSLWLRFEGLNTVNSNSPVVVDIFKFSIDPLKELALISDTFGSFDIEGALLNDPLRPPGTSKYFTVKALN